LNLLLFLLFFGMGPAWPVWLGWTQQSYPGHWPNPVTRLPKACMRELFTHAVHSAKVIKITFAQCYITTTDKKKKELTWCGEAEPKMMTGRFSWIDLRWLYRRCCWLLLTGEWLGRWLAFLLLLLCVFFSSALFSSVSVFFFCFSRCCCRVCCVGSEGGVDGGCWPENGLDCGRPFFFFFSAFFFLLLCSPLFLFSSSVSHGAVVVCAAVEVAGRWSCCGRRRWLFSFLCRGVSLFFSSSLPPSLSRFFLFLTFPLYCFSFPSGPSPPPPPFFLLPLLGPSSGFYSQRMRALWYAYGNGRVRHAPLKQLRYPCKNASLSLYFQPFLSFWRRPWTVRAILNETASFANSKCIFLIWSLDVFCNFVIKPLGKIIIRPLDVSAFSDLVLGFGLFQLSP